MVGSSGPILDPSILQVCHEKMQALITGNLISKIWERIYSNHLEYGLPQYKVDKLDPIMFQNYLGNMTEKNRKYAEDQLFHAISHANDPIPVFFFH